MGNNRWHPNEQTQQSEDMEALLSSLNSDKDVIVVPSDEAGNAGDHGIEDDVAAELEVGGTEVNTDVNVEDTVEEVMAHIQKDDDDDVVDEHISIQPLTTRRLLQLMKSSRNCQSPPIHSTASTETSYTPDQDVEPEVLSDSQQRELIKMALNQRRSSFQLHLSSLVTESRNERIAEWFKTSTPEDEGPFLLEEISDFSNQV
ncbi:hypothetical protein SNE40_015654 [Patella caerulea]|uniref:Uncharacterized protein n=1 Tax=Patella caerulea TaxID=87958 RepID=A0AAN8JIF5_PATCE